MVCVFKHIPVTKDTVHPTNNGSTKDVRPSVVQVETLILNAKPVVAPVIEPVVALVSSLKPNQKPSIPYPSRLHDQKLYALILMLKFGPTIKTLLTNKDKLYELARTTLNEHCSTVLLKMLQEKLGDPDKFLIPRDFSRMDECLAQADLDASINLMPLSVWNKVSLHELSPTYFVVVDFDVDPRVPLILERSFLKTERALIDVFEGELTLRVGKEAITFNLDQTSRYSANYNDMTANQIDVIDMAFDAFLALEDDPTSPKVDHSYFDMEGDILLFETLLNDDPSLPPPTQGKYLPQVRKELKICEAKDDKYSIDEPPEVELKDLPPHLEYNILTNEDFKPAVQQQRRFNSKIHDVIKKELEKLLNVGLIYPISDSSWVSLVHCVPKKGGFTVVKNEENELIPTRLVTRWRVCIDYCKLNEATHKDHFPLPFLDQMLERLAGNEYNCFLDGFSGYIQITSIQKIKKRPHSRVLTECLPIVACPLGYAMHRARFKEKMLKRCKDTNLCLNWEKSHFMVKEGIVLGHKISKNGIKVDKAKVDVITKLPHPTTVKGIRSFLGHASFYRRFIQDFSKIARPMTRLLEKDTPFFFSKEYVEAFQTLKKNLTEAPILIAPD
nr:hypothetical protein [Tanacetum cinerariifolium]